MYNFTCKSAFILILRFKIQFITRLNHTTQGLANGTHANRSHAKIDQKMTLGSQDLRKMLLRFLMTSTYPTGNLDMKSRPLTNSIIILLLMSSKWKVKWRIPTKHLGRVKIAGSRDREESGQVMLRNGWESESMMNARDWRRREEWRNAIENFTCLNLRPRKHELDTNVTVHFLLFQIVRSGDTSRISDIQSVVSRTSSRDE